jgi:hypothetical protein
VIESIHAAMGGSWCHDKPSQRNTPNSPTVGIGVRLDQRAVGRNPTLVHGGSQRVVELDQDEVEQQRVEPGALGVGAEPDFGQLFGKAPETGKPSRRR